MMLANLPRNPAFGTAFAPENRQPFDMIKLMVCSSLHQFAPLCTSLNNGINEMISITCTSLHQFFLCIHKGKRGMGEKAYYMHKPKLVQSGATD
ncbi:hypothetical protein [Brucella anthropi]|uniref:hypothetical protein n=1 Tax=Brucella anthropi TaxID=529 RepID=UPI00124DD325|nr:hypothetical protein [Brucella anthropi]KAB2724153.1 hypothetical protein F9K76_20305 [Brucella anthropi]KAB2739686.1 hypothetical protein F9K74_18460 [Brucella anthropi]KAB2802045.1 hypothetical protein F9K83_18455 [Brucella anthropi]